MEPNRQICPWCDMEIVWDPEIGPEKECPYCFNELGDYRSIRLKVEPGGRSVSVEDREEADSDYSGEQASLHEEQVDDSGFDDEEQLDSLDEFDEAEQDALEAYEQAVQQCRDEQDEAPECGMCQEYMLYVGEQSAADFRPAVPQALGVPLLNGPYTVRMYVCPACFRVEYTLSEDDRMAMMETLRQGKGGA